MLASNPSSPEDARTGAQTTTWKSSEPVYNSCQHKPSHYICAILPEHLKQARTRTGRTCLQNRVVAAGIDGRHVATKEPKLLASVQRQHLNHASTGVEQHPGTTSYCQLPTLQRP